MQFSSLVAAALLSIAQAVDVQVVNVSSSNGTLAYSPNSITAAVGSMVQFQFRGGNHTVTQSNFDNPCTPISSVNSSMLGIYSGFQPVAASAAQGQIPTFTIQINATTPIWIYCSQAKHCQAGMSMVINENTAANQTRSLENYQNFAKNVAQGFQTPTVQGIGAQSTGSTTTGTTGTGAAPGLQAPLVLLGAVLFGSLLV